MKIHLRNAYGLLVAIVAATAASPAGAATPATCVHGVERPLQGTAARQTVLKVASIHPADSSYVTAQTMVVAELEYAIDGFEPDMWQVIAQLETIDPNSTVAGGFLDNPELQYARGVIRFCYPLRGAWADPAVKWPLGLMFHLTRRNDDGSTSVAATTPFTHFNVAQLPAAVLNRPQPTADQVAMRDAVQTLHSFFESVSTHVGLCVETFPAMKSRLTPPLDGWHQRYAKLREKSDALFLGLLRQRYPGIGNADLLAFAEAQRNGMMQAIRGAPQALSEQNCSTMPGRFADGTYDPARQHPEAYALINAMESR